jgi:hypothetical protein
MAPRRCAEMTAEEVLAKVVAEWAEGEAPADPTAASHAVTVALACYRGGGSVSEACEEARAFVGSWTRRPAQRRADRTPSLELAS